MLPVTYSNNLRTSFINQYCFNLVRTYAVRKDIYSYINNLIQQLMPIAESNIPLKQLFQECKKDQHIIYKNITLYVNLLSDLGEPHWTSLRKALEDEESNNADWGTRVVPEIDIANKKEDVIRKHEEKHSGIDLMSKGAETTTKAIVQRSINSRHKLAMMDDALKWMHEQEERCSN